jgi:hypothetical protein
MSNTEEQERLSCFINAHKYEKATRFQVAIFMN